MVLLLMLLGLGLIRGQFDFQRVRLIVDSKGLGIQLIGSLSGIRIGQKLDESTTLFGGMSARRRLNDGTFLDGSNVTEQFFQVTAMDGIRRRMEPNKDGGGCGLFERSYRCFRHGGGHDTDGWIDSTKKVKRNVISRVLLVHYPVDSLIEHGVHFANRKLKFLPVVWIWLVIEIRKNVCMDR